MNMIRFLLLFIDHTTSTYLILFYFLSTFAFAFNVETNDNNDSVLLISNNELIIKGKTIIYISEETVISNFEVIHLDEPDTITIVEEKNKKESFKKLNKLKKNKNQDSEISTLKNKIVSYLPYESYAFFINYISISLGIFPTTDYGKFFLHSDYINNYFEFSVKYKILYYNYIFCDYSICLSQLEIRSP